MRRVRFGLVAALVLLVAGAAAALGVAQPPADPAAPPEAKFQVVPYGHKWAIMIDIETGKTWKLETEPGSKAPVWVPIRRLSTDMEVEEWKQRVEKFKAQRKADR